MQAPLLAVQHLTTSFVSGKRRLVAVDDVSFTLPFATTVALVGESGCGKSVTALSILRLVANPPGVIEGGNVLLNGVDLLALDEAAIRSVRGNRIAMVFQEPMTSLNPVFTVGTQVSEGLILHQRMSRRKARERAIDLLRCVGMPAPEERIYAYPHQLSGGMRQRVMIAMALACSPELLIADEPTTALDVTIQAQILDLIARLQKQFQMSVLLITHDLGVVAQQAEQVMVMYAGRIVEISKVTNLFAAPQHPYTASMLASVPARACASTSASAPLRLPTIEGMAPAPGEASLGCAFANRCIRRLRLGADGERCISQPPIMQQTVTGRFVRCHYPLQAHESAN
jgi:peptide/nickel transport system ATP-binding protein